MRISEALRIAPQREADTEVAGINIHRFYIENAGDNVDATVFRACVDVVERAPETIDIRGCGVVMTATEFRAYSRAYSVTMRQALEQASRWGKRVGVIASPIGGVAPYRAVEHSVNGEIPVAFLGSTHSENAMRTASETDIIMVVDDGLASGVSILRELSPLDRTGLINTASLRLSEAISANNNYTDESLRPAYRAVVEALYQRGIVLSTLFTKNPLFCSALYDFTQTVQGPWSESVQSMLQFSQHILNPDHETPGAMMEGVPCRDVAVTIWDIQAIDSELAAFLANAGFNDIVKMRLFGNRADVLSLNAGDVARVKQQFVQQLRAALVKNS